ncbi:glycosyltransferase [candidate division WWE3 bacterium]|nr:glycosyltransferase [candidate division WWE3 bacterium]
MIDYSIVIPAYNESGKITASLTQVVNFMNSFNESYEVVVVDDGSEDDTVAKIEAYQKEHPKIRLIKNPHKGKGPTVWKGIMEAKGNYIYLADADLSSPMEELKKMAVWLTDHDYDLAIASREGHGAQRVDEPFYRHLMGRVFNFWVQVVALPGIKDSQCGFKLFKNEVAKDIFSRLTIYGEDAPEIKKAYMGAFDVEVLFIALQLGYKIKEVPVKWVYVETTRLNPLSDSIDMALDVLKVRLNTLKGVYNL